jgi:hypothetical protein
LTDGHAPDATVRLRLLVHPPGVAGGCATARARTCDGRLAPVVLRIGGLGTDVGADGARRHVAHDALAGWASNVV